MSESNNRLNVFYVDSFFSAWKFSLVITIIINIIQLIGLFEKFVGLAFYNVSVPDIGVALFYPFIVFFVSTKIMDSKITRAAMILVALLVYIIAVFSIIIDHKDQKFFSEVIHMYTIMIITFFSIAAIPFRLKKNLSKETLKSLSLVYILLTGSIILLLQLVIGDYPMYEDYAKKFIFILLAISLSIRLAVIFLEREHERNSIFEIKQL